MKYAVVRIGKKQFKVAVGDQLLLDKQKEGEISSEVLLFVDEDKILIGQPVLEKMKVGLKRLNEEAGEKVTTIKYKSKSRYRRKYGFRPKFTRILVESIA